MGEPVSKKKETLFMEQEAHFLISLDFSILFF
jgi:hypothetical protein